MSEPQRILIPFSGQQDAVDLCAWTHTLYPEAELLLLYGLDVGVRRGRLPPLETARALAARVPAVRALAVTEMRAWQVAALAALPVDLSQALGLRTMCIACQASLLIGAGLIARQVEAALAMTSREALGQDLDGAINLLVRELAADGGVDCLDVGTPPSSRLSLPIARGERCALARHHGTVEEALTAERAGLLHQWSRDWTRKMLDNAQTSPDLALDWVQLGSS
jgi:hypothetical protein